VTVRVPPGRPGRLWLEHRLATADRGARVLAQKRRALIHLRSDLDSRLADAGTEWEAAARNASDWLARATTLSGERRVRLALAYSGTRASVVVNWQNTLGVLHPVDATLELPEPSDVAALGGNAALASAAEAHRLALQAAARYAVVKAAHERISAELAATARRARAVERRWIPEHRAALERVVLALEEGERDEAVRIRWAKERSALGAGPRTDVVPAVSLDGYDGSPASA